jgi:hypothetical protein
MLDYGSMTIILLIFLIQKIVPFEETENLSEISGLLTIKEYRETDYEIIIAKVQDNKTNFDRKQNIE